MKLFKYFVQNKVWKRAFVIKKLLSNYSDAIFNKLEMDQLIDKFYSLEYHQFISNVAYDISLNKLENTSEQNWFEAEHQYKEMGLILFGFIMKIY